VNPSSPQFKNITYIKPSTSIDERLKFAQLLKLLGTPTWQGGAK
jgi:hypothetical protein